MLSDGNSRRPLSVGEREEDGDGDGERGKQADERRSGR